eukprot:TRINITY_DN10701_c0_g1_i3.p1 TRINITY_DN10701_c0_g1~~TRINITY_DN10701_c0_g1_i3.p1  ORF type:complete len:157 (-),score=19.98 TRINITY_DN10701_c0_g1_i3:109-579(-)
MNVLTNLQLGWCEEMYGYIFAAAALRVKHRITPGLQIRDVEAKLTWSQWEQSSYLMIHMGRAWFPRKYANEVTPQWVHTEGKRLRAPQTEQVWCKCNYTAGTVVPWPLPEGIDMVSNITLTLLHDSLEKYGSPPSNKYRRVADGDPGYKHRFGSSN